MALDLESVLKGLNLTKDELSEKYREKEENGDVAFQIRSKVIVKAHKEVLAAQSAVYSAQFSGNWKLENTIDFSLDVSPEELKTFIALFYFRSSASLNDQNIHAILAVRTLHL